MPTYEYRCKACRRQLEIVQSFTDDALTTCGACGGELRKVFGSVGIAFKGSGFYKNDSRGKPATTPAGTGTNGDSKPAGDKADKAGSDTGGGDGAPSAPKDTGSSTGSTKPDKPKQKDVTGSSSSGSPASP